MKFKTDYFYRKWAGLFSGALVSHILSFLTLLVLGNLVIPSLFGRYVLITTVAAIFATISTLRLESGISSAKSDEEASILIFWSIRISLIFSLAIFSLLFVFKPVIANRLPISSHAFLLLPLLVIVYSLFNIITQLAIRERAFSALAWRGGIQNALIGSFQIIICLWHADIEALVVSEIVGRTLGFFLFLRPFKAFTHRNAKVIKLLFSKRPKFNRELAFYMTTASFLDTAASSAIILFASFCYGDVIAGYFSMSQKLLAFPIALIGATFGQVLLSEASLIIRSNAGGLDFLFNRSFRILVQLSILIASGVFLVAPWLMGHALSKDWSISAELVQWLALSFAINFIWNPLSTLYIAMELWRNFFIFSIVRFLATFVTGGFMFYCAFDYKVTIFSMALAGGLTQILGIALIRVKIEEFSKGKLPGR